MFQNIYFEWGRFYLHCRGSSAVGRVLLPVDKTGTVGLNPTRGMYVRSTPAVFPSLCYPRPRGFTKQLQQDSQT